MKAKEKGLVFKKAISNKDIYINSDPDLLKIIFNHILDNSIKFTNKGGISIGSELCYGEKQNYVRIKFLDSGIGIPKEELENIFSPFRQRSEGLSRSHEGMVLGLYIVKNLTDLLHGSISIKSEIGKATLAILTFNALAEEETIKQNVELSKTSFSINFQEKPPKKPNILNVEDNPGNRILFRKYLENEFLVEDAEDDIIEIAKAESTNYNLILMDINLGTGIDGIETFHRIREIKNYKEIPVVAIKVYACSMIKRNF